ncbi:MAG TPA: ATP-binding protein [Ktedonobacteraceae bacterium]|nr:ATP-binding protein [Ktedonobacteraceae bacterium]
MQTDQGMALRASAHLMLEHAPIGMALFDAHTLCLLTANPAYEALLSPGWQNGRAIGHSLVEWLPAVEHQSIIELFQRVAETGVSARREAYAFPTRTGETRYWNWTLDPIAEHGQVQHLLLTVTEGTAQVLARQIAQQVHTELAQMHEDLEQEQQRHEHLATILLSTHILAEPKTFAQAVLHALDTCFSPQLLALYRTHPVHETLTLLASHSHAKFQQGIFPNLIASTSRHPYLEAMSQRTALIRRTARDTGIKQDEEWKKDPLLSVPDIGCVVYLPLWGKRCEGILIAAFSSEEIVSELIVQTLAECAPYLAETLAAAQVHADLADERQRLHTVLDQLPEGIILVEARTGKVRYANAVAADLLGCALPGLVGAPLNQSALLSPYGLSKERQQATFRWNFALINALWGKTVTNQEIAIPRRDRSEVIVLSSTAPIRASDGLITGAVMVLQDITALKHLERQKNEFFAVANHELRTPLTSILGFVELLQMSGFGETDARQRDVITSIAHECDHLRRLIQELLDVSHLDYAQLNLKKSYQDVLSPLKEIVSNYAQVTSTHRLRFILEDLDPAATLMGWFDLLRIEQIVRNLLTNAVKYSPAGGEIEVGVRPQHDVQGTPQKVLIWVKDQGMGIAASDLPHIFERFYRANTFEKSSISGFGIGLYLSRELVQAHGGRIWAESIRGKGSTFFVLLPLGDGITPSRD